MLDFKYTITDKILNKISEIEGLRQKISEVPLLPEREISLRLRATVEATHSSTSIEGNPLTMRQVEKTLASSKKLSKLEYAKIEVRNYKKAIEYIENETFTEREITLKNVLEIHRLITSDLLDSSRSGKIRFNPVYIENREGTIVYEATPVDIVESELTALLNWLNKTSLNIHPVIVAAILHITFVAIHPFSDGNGRTARALTSLYLKRYGYDFRGALVLDSYYASDREEYYRSIRNITGKNYRDFQSADFTSWLEYFIDGFLASAHILDAETAILSTVVAPSKIKKLSRDESDLLSYASEFETISLSEATSILPSLSERSVQRKLKSLVEKKYLKKLSAGPQTLYKINRK